VTDQGKARVVQTAALFPWARIEEARFLAAFAGETQYGGLLQLKAVSWDGPPGSLKELHGRIRLDVMVRPRSIEIANVFKAIGKEVRDYQGIKVKVLEADTTEDGDIHVRLRLDNLDSLTPMTPEQQVVRVRPWGAGRPRGDGRRDRTAGTGRRPRPALQAVKSGYRQEAFGKGYVADLVFADPGTKLEDLTLTLTKTPRPLAVEMPFVVRDVVWKQ